ncbi:MAG TPA: hypothetical protein VMV91_18150 [Rhodocyclaceae bacterium]|nr:hypothetical protein [Rhodocyclaceae bacterium]
MDESTYGSVAGGINRSPCVFERALLAGCAACALVQRHALAERETLACTDPVAQAGCRDFRDALRQNSSFALKLSDPTQRLPHALEMKLQCGGLRGLQQALLGTAPAAATEDAHALLEQALARYGSLAELPYSRIIQGVAAWSGRKRTASEP